MKAPQVSVVLPVHNRPQMVVEAIGSILDQSATFDDFELIVVDDGSTDDTALRAELACAGQSRTRMVRLGERRGCAAAPSATTATPSGIVNRSACNRGLDADTAIWSCTCTASSTSAPPLEWISTT